MRIVIASDSFKGSMSSERVAEIVAAEARRAWPGCEAACVPMADGGEGTVGAVVAAAGGELRASRVRGPLGTPVDAVWGMLPSGEAVIEMAAASGLTLLAAEERNPLLTSTFGTGELVLAALDAGARGITLAIGGSATNDGGMGCLRALGARILDADGRELAGVGADLGRVAALDLSGLDPRLRGVSLAVLRDVDNPLMGARGATFVFGSQKGASSEALERLEAGMRSYAQVLSRAADGLDTDAPGMGAAGGLGAAMAAIGASLTPGVERVLDLVGFDALLDGAALCVTGEGHADAQSAHGKVISGVARRCQRAGVPCIAFVGGMDEGARELVSCGVTEFVPITPDGESLEGALAHAEANLAHAAARLFGSKRVRANLGQNNALCRASHSAPTHDYSVTSYDAS